MEVPLETRLAFWNHFVEQCLVEKVGGGHGVTGPRLKKIKAAALDSDALWEDVIIRHGVRGQSPTQFKQANPESYAHALGNFWGMLYGAMLKKGYVKP